MINIVNANEQVALDLSHPSSPTIGITTLFFHYLKNSTRREIRVT